MSDKLSLGKRLCALRARISLSVLSVTVKENQKGKVEKKRKKKKMKSRKRRRVSYLKSRLISLRKCEME